MFDYYVLGSSLLNLLTFCEDPMIKYTGDVILDSNQLVNDGLRLGDGILGGYLSLGIAGNITINNNFINFYTYGAEDQPTVAALYYP